MNLINKRRNFETRRGAGDIMQTMIDSSATFTDDVMIVDEIITFMIAGSTTTAVTSCNALCYMMMDKTVQSKILQALRTNYPGFDQKTLDQIIEMDSLDKDDYLKLCFYESLRIEPPVIFNSAIMATEDTTIAGFKIKKGDPIY